MHTNRVHIFHIADCNAVSNMVTDNFTFNFFPTGNAAFYQYLMHTAALQTKRCNLFQLLFIRCNTTATATQRISWTDNNWVTNTVGNLKTGFQIFRYSTVCTRLMNTLHCFLEKLAVLCHADCIRTGANHLNIVFL